MSAGVKHDWRTDRISNPEGGTLVSICRRCSKRIDATEREYRANGNEFSDEIRKTYNEWCIEPPPPPKTLDDCFALLEKIAGKLEIPLTYGP